MFINAFTTIAGLAALMYGQLSCTKITTTQPINVTNSTINNSNSLSTSIEFTINSTNFAQLFDYYDDGYNNYADYFIYKAEHQSIGALRFKFIQESSNDFYFHVETVNFDDVYNLYIGVETYFTSDDSDNYHGTDNFFLNMSIAENQTFIFNTPLIGTNPNTYFNVDDGELTIIITLSPMDSLQYGGTVDVETAYENGQAEGYANGFADGVSFVQDQDSAASVIFTGIVNIGLMPINFFLGVLNFEVFGINIGALVASLLTVAITLIIVRIIFSGGNGKGGDQK